MPSFLEKYEQERISQMPSFLKKYKKERISQMPSFLDKYEQERISQMPSFGAQCTEVEYSCKVSLLLLIHNEILNKGPLLKHCNRKMVAMIQLWYVF
jgi:hypothetical protein